MAGTLKRGHFFRTLGVCSISTWNWNETKQLQSSIARSCNQLSCCSVSCLFSGFPCNKFRGERGSVTHEDDVAGEEDGEEENPEWRPVVAEEPRWLAAEVGAEAHPVRVAHVAKGLEEVLLSGMGSSTKLSTVLFATVQTDVKSEPR